MPTSLGYCWSDVHQLGCTWFGCMLQVHLPVAVKNELSQWLFDMKKCTVKGVGGSELRLQQAGCNIAHSNCSHEISYMPLGVVTSHFLVFSGSASSMWLPEQINLMVFLHLLRCSVISLYNF